MRFPTRPGWVTVDLTERLAVRERMAGLDLDTLAHIRDNGTLPELRTMAANEMKRRADND